ncbi:Fe(3+) ABC transporter substrate-binding protein [Helicobacter cholecystus]|uniref:Fe(3+) ABC transporter substrate-binding protein n=1 Tax=Helicobacter cholecystus TaxID=45498 RepID=A0A3D8IVF5_9HELI|nr:Fe(3+) ABC transporter substrate-binding protein [Helicobacter cholecystus]RDU68956.1 Fe(3+) ABC transporter substrate-binding protein [Helicobacter cholecystus]VEJ25987.1 Iron uptake protein A1 precursor [Helicobacter cholecystus]
MKKIIAFSILSSLLFCAELNIYSSRHYDADFEIIKKFEQKTGIKVHHTQAKPQELIKRMRLEGENSKADLFITADISNLTEAKNSNLLASVDSPILKEMIPSYLRDEDNEWFAITKRARVIVYAKDRGVNPNLIRTYEDLINPNLKGKLLVRSATAAYSKTLLASIIVHHGESEAKKWAKGVLDNLASDPKGGDRDQARRVYAGEGDFAIMNTYYIGLMKHSKNPQDVKVANSLAIIFPNQESYGTHINVSGVAMTKSSKNRKEAQAFMEFLLSKEVQEMLTNINFEYPIRDDVPLNATIKSFGKFKADQTPLSDIAKKVKEAVKIYDEVGFR